MAFVLYAWGKAENAHGAVKFLADGNAKFAKTVGLTLDLDGIGFGLRSKRYAMIINDGKIEYLGVDEKGLEKSSAEAVLANL